MDPIAAARAAVADELTAAGVAHTTDPRNLVAPGVLVGVLDPAGVLRKRGSLVDVPVPVAVVGVGPYNDDAVAALAPLVGAVLGALSAPDATGTFTGEDPPTFTITAAVTVGYSTSSSGAVLELDGVTYRVSQAALTPTLTPAAPIHTLRAVRAARPSAAYTLDLTFASDWGAAPSLCRALMEGWRAGGALVAFTVTPDGATFDGKALVVPPPILTGSTDPTTVSLPVVELTERGAP